MPADQDQPDVAGLHARSVQLFLDRVRAVPDHAWERPTPCKDWDVRTLVNHVVGEDRWTVPLVEGQTIAQVGDSLDGDLLGAEPKAAATQAGEDAVEAFAAPGAMSRTVQLSFGETPAAEYAWQLFADHVVHTWDLAVASGGDPVIDQELVEECARWWAGWEDTYRAAGAVGEPIDLAPDATAQDRLLAAFGRDPGWGAS